MKPDCGKFILCEWEKESLYNYNQCCHDEIPPNNFESSSLPLCENHLGSLLKIQILRPHPQRFGETPQVIWMLVIQRVYLEKCQPREKSYFQVQHRRVIIWIHFGEKNGFILNNGEGGKRSLFSYTRSSVSKFK